MVADPVALTQQLLRCPSVTPHEAGSLAFVADFLTPKGFSIERFDSNDVSNLYARLGTSSPHLCFVGHTDVVPTGDLNRWSVDPFKGEIRDDKLYGRGVVDMKGGIGAFLAALDAHLSLKALTHGSLSILLTTDEEGPATDGIKHVLEVFKARAEKIDACLVGEPSNTQKVGDTLKVGRRGSLNATLTVQGRSGHVAYPHLAKNPLEPLINYLKALTERPMDAGVPNFDPSNLVITTIDVGNPTRNVIPQEATAKFNIRFNPAHTFETLSQYLQEKADQLGLNRDGFTYALELLGSGDAFICQDKALEELVSGAVEKVTGIKPSVSTGGGTSDARFMKDICPVIEFGLVNATAHHIDEHIEVSEIHKLTAVYQEILNQFFKDK
jgi:succinyl-diaminopimelate desuccinylase